MSKTEQRLSGRFTERVFYLKAVRLSPLTYIARGVYTLPSSFDHVCVPRTITHFLYVRGKIHSSPQFASTFH